MADGRIELSDSRAILNKGKQRKAKLSQGVETSLEVAKQSYFTSTKLYSKEYVVIKSYLS